VPVRAVVIVRVLPRTVPVRQRPVHRIEARATRRRRSTARPDRQGFPPLAPKGKRVQHRRMSFYRDQVLPRFQDKIMARKPNRAVRERVCEGEKLDLPSGEFDAALSTWTLCTIPNLDAALAEIPRVLKPGGSFHFVEHGHSPDERVARTQARLEPINKCLAGGCHLTRHISEDIERAGFHIEKIETYYFKGEPKPMGYTYEGRAISR
jgi:SAM-dependent methyltransferase